MEFTYKGISYRTYESAEEIYSNGYAILLPGSRYLSIDGWLETDPPVPSKFFEVFIKPGEPYVQAFVSDLKQQKISNGFLNIDKFAVNLSKIIYIDFDAINQTTSSIKGVRICFDTTNNQGKPYSIFLTGDSAQKLRDNFNQ